MEVTSVFAGPGVELFAILSLVVSPIISFVVARRRGLPGVAFALLALFFGPLGIVAAALFPARLLDTRATPA